VQAAPGHTTAATVQAVAAAGWPVTYCSSQLPLPQATMQVVAVAGSSRHTTAGKRAGNCYRRRLCKLSLSLPQAALGHTTAGSCAGYSCRRQLSVLSLLQAALGYSSSTKKKKHAAIVITKRAIKNSTLRT